MVEQMLKLKFHFHRKAMPPFISWEGNTQKKYKDLEVYMITVVFIFNGFLSTFSQYSNYSFIHVFQDTLPVRLIHSHKKRKDSLKTWAERAVLRAYVENQAVLEPILPYRGSKYKQKGQVLRLFVNSNFTFLSE